MIKKSLSIIVPVYNEQDSLPVLIQRLNLVRQSMESNLDIEYIFISDGSTDRSIKILEEYASIYKFIKIICFSRNFGHQYAVSCGLQNSLTDYAVIIDADLQDPPELISEMYRLSVQGYDVVYGQRNIRKGENFFKKLSANIFYKLLNFLSDIKIPHNTGDFRLITKKVLLEFRKCKEKHKFIRGLIPWLGFSSVAILYDRDSRYSGKTKYNLIKMINLALDAIFSFSSKSISIISKLGFFIIILSFFYGLFVLYKKIILNDVIPGFTALFITILFFSGVNLIFLGIVGQYIARIFDQVKDRPEYVIERSINFDLDQNTK
jgi:glycosyltransferase involved in cell wall biosynthesis